jgi:hypothetical protein
VFKQQTRTHLVMIVVDYIILFDINDSHSELGEASHGFEQVESRL